LSVQRRKESSALGWSLLEGEGKKAQSLVAGTGRRGKNRKGVGGYKDPRRFGKGQGRK